MKITRDIVSDLWPLCVSGEASPDSRALVDEFLAQDRELRPKPRTTQILLQPAAVTLLPDLEHDPDADPRAPRPFQAPPQRRFYGPRDCARSRTHPGCVSPQLHSHRLVAVVLWAICYFIDRVGDPQLVNLPFLHRGERSLMTTKSCLRPKRCKPSPSALFGGRAFCSHCPQRLSCQHSNGLVFAKWIQPRQRQSWPALYWFRCAH